jgi:hypothetical protein
LPGPWALELIYKKCEEKVGGLPQTRELPWIDSHRWYKGGGTAIRDAFEIPISLAILFVLGLSTIFSQTPKAAAANPVDSLRHEQVRNMPEIVARGYRMPPELERESFLTIIISAGLFRHFSAG